MSNSLFITFKDPIVRANVPADFGSNTDKLSKKDALIVFTPYNFEHQSNTKMNYLKGSAIETFDEFKYFKGATEFPSFQNCPNIKSVTPPASLTKISRFTFGDCPNLINMTIPKNITTIGESAFYNCKKLEMGGNLPEHITSIGAYAFQYCNKLLISDISCATYIGASAFANCYVAPLRNLNNELNANQDIKSNTFDLCAQAEFDNLPNKITGIAQFAFRGCKKCTFNVIPNSVTSIGRLAFSETNNAHFTSFPEALTYDKMGDSIFMNSLGIQTFSWSNNIDRIKNGTFYGCSNLTSFTMGVNVKVVEAEAFYNCAKLQIDTALFEQFTSIGKNAFRGCTKLPSILVLTNLTYIGSFAFLGCSQIKKVKLPYDGVVELGINTGTSYAAPFADNTEIYVSDPDAYKAATGWNTLSSSQLSKLHPLSEWTD